ncbi:SMP-30/gluconolactonase/LRE family protein [Streptomyces sp. CC224B]|uniref:SMP-30/gluconolactonase/LRE family protein n=1 Tax=Streptomyces sp. CC224B TaxID=3044571 RepID=UPI0024A8DA44|nr:SMP-30/gluconolactonase/LRE family protein [Streptomyces sp. CC224B]
MSPLPSSRRRRTLAAAVGLVLAGLAAPSAEAAAPADVRPASQREHAPSVRIKTAYELPGDRVYPEGIARDARTGEVFVTSFTTGAVHRARPGRLRAEVFLPSGTDGRTTANGLKVDRAGRLWVTDSRTGVAVYDIRSRRLVARFDVPGDTGRFVNDVALTPDGTAYLTDSVRAVVYRVTPRQLAYAAAHGGRGPLTPYTDLHDHVEPAGPDGFALNGIAADDAGRYLLTVDMADGRLYRVSTATGGVREVALRGGDMAHGDGLELRGGRLWVAHNASYQISRWRLNGTGTAARLERRVGDPALQLPTTLVRERGRLLVVRSQFDKGGPMGPGTPAGPFTVAAVDGI